MKPKRQRLWFIVFGMVMLSAAATLILISFKDNLVFFYSPSDIAQKPPAINQFVRIGGLVVKDSLTHPTPEDLTFAVSDGASTLTVYFKGVPPALFREGQGVVAEGSLGKNGTFVATRILAKHDENYMPPEVAAAIKKQGRWRGAP